MIENAFSGVILTAQSFNPSIFTESWLVQNGLLQSEDFQGVRVFSPEVAQFTASGFQALIVPPKMQLTFGLLDQDQSTLTVPLAVAARIVELLPHTPYQALGLNFDYFISNPRETNFPAFTRSLLGAGSGTLSTEFAADDARFGRYFSKDYGAARLRLDIKPVKTGPDNKDMLQFGFNFHHDLSTVAENERPSRIASLLGTWEQLWKYSATLAGSVVSP